MIKIFLLITFLFNNSFADTIYQTPTKIPLSWSRNTGGSLVSGLTVTVSVKNAITNATLLSSTSMPEIATGAGIYSYSWSPGTYADTLCLVTYTVGSSIYTEYIYISSDETGGRAN